MDERAHTQALELTFTTTLKTVFFQKIPIIVAHVRWFLHKITRGYSIDTLISYSNVLDIQVHFVVYETP